MPRIELAVLKVYSLEDLTQPSQATSPLFFLSLYKLGAKH